MTKVLFHSDETLRNEAYLELRPGFFGHPVFIQGVTLNQAVTFNFS